MCLGPLVIAAAIASAPAAQSPAPPAFDVIAIRPSAPDANGANFEFQPGGRFVGTNAALAALIRIAYGEDGRPLASDRMSVNSQWAGGSGFLASNRFDVEAKASGDLTREQMQVALQGLLAERFGLVIHHERKELPSYVLTVARPDKHLGPRLHPADVDCADTRQRGASCSFESFPGRATGHTTIAAFARWLSGALDDHRPVEDATSLSGTFEIVLEWTQDRQTRSPNDADAPDMNANGPSLFTAVQEQLGLKLEPIKSLLDVLVIDHATRPTSD